MGRGGHFFVAGELGVKFFLCVRLRVRCPSHPPIAQVVALDERATAGVFVASGRGQSRHACIYESYSKITRHVQEREVDVAGSGQ